MIIDHIGIVVRDLNAALGQWQRLFGYLKSSDVVINERQRVRVVFLSKPDSLVVKLIEPTAPDSPAYQAARRGGGLHHLCFQCSELNDQIRLFERQGVRLLVPPEPGEAFRNHPIAFMLAEGNIQFELIDTSEKQGWTACSGERSRESA